MKHLLVVAFSFYLFVSCSCGSTTFENKTENIVSVKWYLESINGNAIKSKSDDSEIPYVVFSKERDLPDLLDVIIFPVIISTKMGNSRLMQVQSLKNTAVIVSRWNFLMQLKRCRLLKAKTTHLFCLTAVRKL